jgi:redox-sensitive bicupin YhaK (pirin superfamily)
VAAGFEHGVLVDQGPVRLGDVELAPSDLGYLPPGAEQLRLTNPTARPARVMVLGGEPFPEPIVMWWNFLGRTHEEIAGFRDEWEAGSERFGTVRGYTGDVQRLPAPSLPTVHLRPRINPPAGDASAWG